jgi:antagonist of KipI
MIAVIKPGLLTTVQDSGRWGHQHEGIPVAGPMDPWSHDRANRLVGNGAGAATLEITLAGPRLRVEAPAIAAIVGGAFPVRIDRRELAMGTPFALEPGDELEIGRCTLGARAYLALRGGVDVPPVLGSRATPLPSLMGGLHGRPLVAGDTLTVGSCGIGPVRWGVTSPVRGGDDAIVRVLPGPDDDAGLEASMAGLMSARFQVSPDSNRMGYRLRGAAVDAPPADRLSTPTPMGTIQVPEGGAPIVLMADRQTTGGYARVATVISADLGLVGQMKPGDWLTFAVCSHDAALAALRERMKDVDA